MKKSNFKCLALLCCCMLCLVFSGCAKVTYSMVRSDDYTILQQIKVELDASIIEDYNTDIVELKNDIESYIYSYDESMYSFFRSNLFTLKTISSNYTHLAPYIEQAVQTEYAWIGNTLIYNILFTAIMDEKNIYLPVENVYYFYYSGEFEYTGGSDDIKKDYVDKLFVQMYKETYTTSFDSVMCDEIEQTFLDKYGEKGFTTEDVAYVYQYGQQYSRVHSDADSVRKEDGVYIHTWNLESKDDAITLFRVYAKPVAWYIVAIICGILTVVIFVIVAFVKGKKNVPQMVTNADTKNDE